MGTSRNRTDVGLDLPRAFGRQPSPAMLRRGTLNRSGTLGWPARCAGVVPQAPAGLVGVVSVVPVGGPVASLSPAPPGAARAHRAALTALRR